MPHHCEVTLITCEDFRLHQRKDGKNFISDFIKQTGSDCDVITRAGAIKDLVDRADSHFDESVIRDCVVSMKLHRAKTIYLVNHEDCGAYHSNHKFASCREELEKHRRDLKKVRDILAKRFPDKEIKLYLAKLKDGSEHEYIIKQVEEELMPAQ